MPVARYTEPWERRPGLRIRASQPIVFEWHTEEGDVRRLRGTTHDISTGGVYCYTDQPLPEGSEVKFNTVFPPELASGENANFACSGRVLRSSRLGRHFGLGVKIEDRRPVMTERPSGWRREHRVMPFAPLSATYHGRRAVVRNLSSSGAYLEDDRPFLPGHDLELLLGGPSLLPDIAVRAVVRRTEPHVGMAVEFSGFSADADRRLHELLGRYEHR